MPSTDQTAISFGREPFNGYSHLFGAVAAVAGGVILLSRVDGDAPLLAACALYSASLFLAFFSSALFHLVDGPPGLTRRLHDFDHHCIRSLILGTFAPMAVVMLPSAWALASLLLLATAVIANAVIVSRKRGEISRSKMAAWYFLLTTLSLPAIPFCWADFSQPILWTTFGSSFYIIGAVCYVKKIPRRARCLNFHGVWHICVLIGAFVHYLVILNLV